MLFVFGINKVEVSLDTVYPEFYKVFCSQKKNKYLIKLQEA